MTKQSFRKQRGGSGVGDDDMMSTPGGDSFSGSSIKGEENIDANIILNVNTENTVHAVDTLNTNVAVDVDVVVTQAFLTPGVLLAAQKLVQHNGLSF